MPFDVVSLFTNVSVDLACRVAEQCLVADDSLEDQTSLSPDQIISLLQLCLNTTFLAFREKFYQQVYGTAIGSPVFVTVANFVMEDVEQRALLSFTSPPSFWKQYGDDVLEDIQPFLNHMNSIKSSIQFTSEEEEGGALLFLDGNVVHSPDGSLSTRVFRKRTHTDRHLHFSSHPLSQNVHWPIISC